VRRVKFKIDENLPSEYVAILRQAKHEADTVRDEGLGGKIDEIVADFCQNEDRVLVTLDRDFSDIRAYPPERHPGIIAISVARQSKRRLLDVLARIVVLLDSEPVRNRLWVVEDNRIRVRTGSDR
jgi:predicted nuclease of predicted toxin-antitoxin system